MSVRDGGEDKEGEVVGEVWAKEEGTKADIEREEIYVFLVLLGKRMKR